MKQSALKKMNGKIKTLVLCMAILLSFAIPSQPVSAATKLTGKTKNMAYKYTPYGQHGKLQVQGANLVDKNGEVFQLKGISTHGINWDVGYPYVNEKAFANLRDEWGVNCIRIAMYTQDYNGYCVTSASERKKLLKTIDKAVKATKKLGMYVIIDWHVLNDQTPQKYQKQAKTFFKTVAKKYKKYGNVLYEICNEPNGGTSWETIKSYADSVIPVIRKYNKNAIIIVGTPNWSQDVDVASESPITGYQNIMYSIHFYAATHQQSYRDKCETALKNGLPVICTEFSACESSGDGSYDFNSANAWITLLDQYNVSYCAWSLSNKAESASLLKSSCKKTSGFKTSNVSKMAKWLIEKYKSTTP